MKTKVIIWGSSMLSSMMHDILQKEDIVEVVGFTDYENYIKNGIFCGLKNIPFEKINLYYDMNECEIMLTIGYSKMNFFREKIYKECKELNYKVHTYISPNCMLYSHEIGEGTIIMPSVFVGPNVKLGLCTILNFNVCVSHDICIGDYCFLAGGVTMGGKISMGDNCFIGLNCTLRNGIRVSNKTLLGANIYLDKNTKEGEGYVNMASTAIKKMDSEILIDFV